MSMCICAGCAFFYIAVLNPISRYWTAALCMERIDLSYASAKPEADNAAFTLIQGGMRSTAGLLGKRSKDRVVLTTLVASIDMQDASVIVQYREPSAEAIAVWQAYLLASVVALDASLMSTRSDAPPLVGAIRPLMLAQGLPPQPGNGLASGLYVQVLDGMINVSNGGGSANFCAGQFGFTPSVKQPPIILPANPGMHFTPPPAFSGSTAIPTGNSSSSKFNNVDCEVR